MQKKEEPYVEIGDVKTLQEERQKEADKKAAGKQAEKGASDLQKGLAIFLSILAGVYTVSPIDILPDAIPVLGWMDDLGVSAFAVLNVVQQFTSNQKSLLVKIVKYFKWFLILATVGIVLLFGGLIFLFFETVQHYKP